MNMSILWFTSTYPHIQKETVRWITTCSEDAGWCKLIENLTIQISSQLSTEIDKTKDFLKSRTNNWTSVSNMQIEIIWFFILTKSTFSITLDRMFLRKLGFCEFLRPHCSDKYFETDCVFSVSLHNFFL